MDDDRKNRFTFTWKIKNCLAYNSGERISSPTFVVHFLAVQEWSLDFYLNKYCDENFKYTECYLSRKKPDSIPQTAHLNFKMEFFDTNGHVLGSKCNDREFKTNASWGFDMLEVDELHESMKTWPEDTLTIRCTITSHESTENPSTTECEALTVLDVDSRALKWNLSNFELSNSAEVVTLPSLDSFGFKIAINARGEILNITIQTLKGDLLNKLTRFKVTFLSEMFGEITSKCEVHTFESMEAWQYPSFVSREDLKLMNSARQKCAIICECAVARGEIASSVVERYIYSLTFSRELNPKLSPRVRLQEDFQQLCFSKKFSDVKLRAENKDFPAHKAVLATRSPVFSTMFDQEMLESRTGVVDIKDVDGDTLQYLIQFIYTETLNDMDCESALKLLLAANKYQVQTLVEECSSMVLSYLNVENVCGVIKVADMISHKSLKNLAFNYILINAAAVLESPNWSDMIEKNAKLTTDILIKVSKYLNHKKLPEDR